MNPVFFASIHLRNVGIRTFPQWQLHPLNSADERARGTHCAEAGLRVTRVTLCSLEDADKEPRKGTRPSLELKQHRDPICLSCHWSGKEDCKFPLPRSLILLPVHYRWIPRGRMWPLAPGSYLKKRDAPHLHLGSAEGLHFPFYQGLQHVSSHREGEITVEEKAFSSF